MMAHLHLYLDPLSPHQLKKEEKKSYQIWTPSDNTFWIHIAQLVASPTADPGVASSIMK